MAEGKYLFTSESVSMGHPDKLADRISDGILDALFEQDPQSRVACETMVTTGFVVIAGEITTAAEIDYEEVVRTVIREVGYTDEELGFNADTCQFVQKIHSQSADIAQGVDEDVEIGKDVGAGDQGLMFGYACRDTKEELMPLPIALSHRILDRLTQARQDNEVDWLRPDSKSQVTVEYEGNTPKRIDTIVVSTQHSDKVSNEDIHSFVKEIIKPILPAELDKGDITYHINPTGRFVIGGPHGDCGLTGRKVIVDTYGGWGRHGGGAFSGKDPTKVDRSAAYMARHIAKNIVAAKLAERCEVQLAYAIGVAEPVSVCVDTEGTGQVDDSRLCELVREHFELTPRGIIEYLDLRRPIYRQTTAGGHFGRKEFSWERTDKAAELAEAAGLTGATTN